MSSATDRNLLFGILALQMDFITREQLVAAMNAWVLRKAEPLGVILQEHGALSAERRTLLDALVGEHLRQHGDDTQKSLAALSSLGAARQDLQQLPDAEVQASLAVVSMARQDDDSHLTRSYAVGEASSVGTRFRILRPHAEGGLGKVSVALDAELRREVALKEIKQKHPTTPAAAAASCSKPKSPAAWSTPASSRSTAWERMPTAGRSTQCASLKGTV